MAGPSVGRAARRVCVAGFLLVAVAGVPRAGSAQALEWRALVGCYRTQGLRFALDSLPAVNRAGGPIPNALRAHEYPARGNDVYWRMVQEDTLDFVLGNGLHGGTTRYVARGDTLVGELRAYTDIAGVKLRPIRQVAVREPCGPGAEDGSPPDAIALRDSLPGVVARVIVDSILPRVPTPFSIRNTVYPFGWSATVAKLLSSAPGAVPTRADAVFGTWVEAQDLDHTRDEASAIVLIESCEDRAAPNLARRRTRIRFRRVGSAWQLASIEPAGDVVGRCGASLQ